jgi:hypothetical protein
MLETSQTQSNMLVYTAVQIPGLLLKQDIEWQPQQQWQQRWGSGSSTGVFWVVRFLRCTQYKSAP